MVPQSSVSKLLSWLKVISECLSCVYCANWQTVVLYRVKVFSYLPFGVTGNVFSEMSNVLFEYNTNLYV